MKKNLEKTNTITKKDIINMVDAKVREYGLTDEILGLKTANDKILYYYNYLDPSNRFAGLVEFPTVYCIKFANVLCKDEEMVQKYLNEYYNPEFEQWEVINSLQEFRKDILNKRIDVSEYKDEIKSCIDNENWKSLWDVLQNLFLEPLAWSHIVVVNKKCAKKAEKFEQANKHEDINFYGRKSESSFGQRLISL